jgi:uncharacterized protein (TIGR00251 family)
MIALETRAEGVVLPVRAQPGAGRNALLGEHHGALKVAVTQAPEKGKANKALLAVLSKSLALRKSQIHLIAGETNPHKKFLVAGVTEAELRAKIDAATGNS